MIYDLVDTAFRILMWMLLDPVGSKAFMALDLLLLVGCSSYLIWDFRREDGMENSERSSNAGS